MHVFISYSRLDTEFVEQLERDLKSRGITTWRDHEIQGGWEWEQAIVDAMDDAYSMICVVTQPSTQSRWVRRESQYADDNGIPRVPILVKPQAHRIPFNMIDLQPIDFIKKHYDIALDELVTVTNQHLQNPSNVNLRTPKSDDNLPQYLRLLLAEIKAELRDALYVDLSATPQTPTRPVNPLNFGLGTDDYTFTSVDVEQIQGDAFDNGTPVDDVREILHTGRHLLLGDPGAGKTTTLYKLTIDLARALQANLDDTTLKIPVFVPLREFSGDIPFPNFVKTKLSTLQDQYDDLLRDGRLMLLCDALNEMPRTADDGRDLVAEVRDYLRDQPHWVISCRVRDYQEDLRDLTDMNKVQLKPLDPPRIKQFIERIYAQANLSERGEALWEATFGNDDLLQAWDAFAEAGLHDDFWTHTDLWKLPDPLNSIQLKPPHYAWIDMRQDKRRIMPLCRNPFMTDMVCKLFAQAGKLPDNRGKLFGDFVHNLLQREKSSCEATGADWLDDSLIRTGLAQIAYQMGAETEMPRDDAITIIRDTLTDDIDAELLLRLGTSANLLDASTTIRFTHQLLQEYFASEVMGALIDNEVDPTTIWHPDKWWQATGREETLRILAGVRGDPESVARWIAPANPAFALEILTQVDTQVDLETLDSKLRELLIASANQRINAEKPVERASAYRALGLLNADNRAGVGLREDGLPDIQWGKPIPLGTYTIGRDEESPNSLKEQQVELGYNYQLAKYPVTYAQYQAFVEAEDGFHVDQWWDGFPDIDKGFSGREVEIRELRTQIFQYANHPRDEISWYQTIAFCRWLTHRYREQGLLAEGDVIRLPTSHEWEIAARYPDGRKFAWGNEFDKNKINTIESGIEQTTAVGMYEAGKHPELDIYDLNGNVWEWTLTELGIGHNTYRPSVSRVLRGGSWLDNFHKSCSTSRGRNYPHYWLSNDGFRVVCAPPLNAIDAV